MAETSEYSAQDTPGESVGPLLIARGVRGKSHSIAALLLLPPDDDPPPLYPGEGRPLAPCLLARGKRAIWRYDFVLSPDAPHYRLGQQLYPVALPAAGQTRVAFVSCNGQEEGDLTRPEVERNALWYELQREHEKSPFHLMLHGGDQLYADPVWECHPQLAQWQELSRREKQRQPFTDEIRRAAFDFYLERYSLVYAQPPTAWLLARIPSLMIWDDHDIFDGWGSHPNWFLNTPTASGLFQVAREAFCLLQLAAPATEAPEGALNPTRRSLGWRCRFPDFTVIAPDLRSERRPDQVMGAAGWRGFRQAMEAEPDGRRILLLSSVPTLGPRLSWIEACIGIVPKLRAFEDDLRDQWQSRHHREEWTRYLAFLEQQANARRQRITLLSGEIHLATRAEMQLASGQLHQLVASGIAHPPPPQAYARGLGMLASLGQAPLPGRPIQLLPLPGQRRIYSAERNFLLLDQRHPGYWEATWYLEESGWTPPLAI